MSTNQEQLDRYQKYGLDIKIIDPKISNNVNSEHDNKRKVVSILIMSNDELPFNPSYEINNRIAIVGQVDMPIDLALNVSQGNLKDKKVFSTYNLRATERALKEIKESYPSCKIRCPIYGKINEKNNVTLCKDIQIGATETAKNYEISHIETAFRCAYEEFNLDASLLEIVKDISYRKDLYNKEVAVVIFKKKE